MINISKIHEQSNCVYNFNEIQQSIYKVSNQINHLLIDQELIVLCVVKGGIVLTGQILPLLKMPIILDYVHLSRYGEKVVGSHNFKSIFFPSISLEGKNILLIDDILDEGLTLKAIYDQCFKRGAKNISSLVLVDKPKNRHVNGVQSANFSALTYEGDDFLYGYGMDIQLYLRNVNGIFEIAPNLIS
jgi:hypoxanthine phosphoribosyltransferase